MKEQISISEARSRLNELLKDVKQRPDRVYEITINDVVMGEIKAPASDRGEVLPGDVFSRVLEDFPNPEGKQPDSTASVAEDHDRFLYGNP